jgi:hypothetical protein
MGHWRSVAVVGVLVCATSCAPGTPATNPTAPEFRITGDGAPLVLAASSFCVPGACATGPFLEPRPSVGVADRLLVTISEPGWIISGTLHKVGTRCDEKYTVALTKLDDDRWQLLPKGPADRYEVRLDGVGPTGSAGTAFVWTTTTDVAAAPEPC